MIKWIRDAIIKHQYNVIQEKTARIEQLETFLMEEIETNTMMSTVLFDIPGVKDQFEESILFGRKAKTDWYDTAKKWINEQKESLKLYDQRN